MTLQTFDVPFLEGMVCYVTDKNTGGHDVTIECYDRNIAFLVHYDRRQSVSVGDWVRFRGKVRMDPGINQDGKLREQNLGYYHEPKDGSSRTDWLFFMLVEAGVSLLGPPGAMDTIRAAMTRMRRHADSWTANDNIESLRETIAIIDAARDLFQSELRSKVIAKEELYAPVNAIDINID